MKLKADEILVLRTCNAGMTAYSGFKWPRRGKVEAPDWKDTNKCGHGLHGLPRGEGDGGLLSWDADAVWLVVRVSTAKGGYGAGKDELERKCKFRAGTVVYAGDRKTATDMIMAAHPGAVVVGAFITGGDRSTVTGGDGSTVTGGNWSTVTGGYGSTVTGGGGSTVTGGNGSTVTGGNWSTVTGGDRSTVTGGDRSTVTGGDGSTVTGGDGSVLSILYWDDKTERRRIVTAYVGEKGIMPGVKYRLNDKHKFEAVE